MSNKGQSLKEALSSIFATSVIVLALAVAIVIYKFVMGNPANFEGGNINGHAIQGNYLGMIYKGGPIVPILITVILVLLTFCFERWITLARAKGRGRLSTFVRNIQTMLKEDKIEEAIQVCDKQRGSLANVLKAGLHRYRSLQSDTTLANDQKVLALQKELEEATALELPILSKNLVILSTIASIAVLIGLIGTVIGMIRAFGAMATSGAPDAVQLAQGVSEALINTAFGITGSTISIIMYNFFSTKIDATTYKIDEAAFSLTQSFATSLKK